MDVGDTPAPNVVQDSLMKALSVLIMLELTKVNFEVTSRKGNQETHRSKSHGYDFEGMLIVPFGRTLANHFYKRQNVLTSSCLFVTPSHRSVQNWRVK